MIVPSIFDTIFFSLLFILFLRITFDQAEYTFYEEGRTASILDKLVFFCDAFTTSVFGFIVSYGIAGYFLR